jgi:hypothetical protein
MSLIPILLAHCVSEAIMTTQNLPLNHSAKSGQAGAMAIFFFLIGAPHIYSGLQRRRQQQQLLQAQLLAPKSLGLASLAIGMAVGLYAAI